MRSASGSADRTDVSRTAGGEGTLHDPTPPRSRLNVPNALCFLRLALAPLLVVLAARDARLALLATFLVMTTTDWIDGKLAVLLDQRTEFGARLDSFADAAMYAALVVGAVWMDGDRLRTESPWLVAALGSYLLAGLVGLLRFGRWPSNHSWLAKVSWFLVLVGASLFLLAPTGILGAAEGVLARWPLRLALTVVVLGNLQSLVITLALPEWRSDVGSIGRARRLRAEARSAERQGSASGD